jgi:hypothetical protein
MRWVLQTSVQSSTFSIPVASLYLNITILFSHAVGSPDLSSKLYLQYSGCEPLSESNATVLPTRWGLQTSVQSSTYSIIFLLRALSESNATVLPCGGVSRLPFKALPTVFLLLTYRNLTLLFSPRGGVSKLIQQK